MTLTPGSIEPGFFHQIPHFDKLVHFAMFCIFGGLAYLGWSDEKKSKKDAARLENALKIQDNTGLCAAYQRTSCLFIFFVLKITRVQGFQANMELPAAHHRTR